MLLRCLSCHRDDLLENRQFCPHCGASVSFWLGEILSKGTTLRSHTYCLDEAMGKGSFGITYRAHHISLNHAVAIKEFYPVEYASRNPETQRLIIPNQYQEAYQRSLLRFLEEGRLLAKLSHPNVVKVHDLFEERNTAYLVMDLVQGKTLLQELENQPNRRLSSEQTDQKLLKNGGKIDIKTTLKYLILRKKALKFCMDNLHYPY